MEADDWQYWVLSLALHTGSLIYWLPTPSGIQPLLQPLPAKVWRLLAQ